MTVLILSWFLTFYLLEDGERGWQWSLRSLSTSQRIRLLEAGRTVIADLGSYLRWAAAVSGAMAAAALVALTLAGIPLAGPLSMLVLLAGMVPFYGPVFAVGLVAILALADQGPILAILVGAAVLLARIAASALIDRVDDAGETRAAGGDAVGPAIGLVAIPIAAIGIGLFGLFIAVPADDHPAGHRDGHDRRRSARGRTRTHRPRSSRCGSPGARPGASGCWSDSP